MKIARKFRRKIEIMKTSLTTFVIVIITSHFILSTLPIRAQQPNDWENPAVFAKNQTEPHVAVVPYQNHESALKYSKEDSPYYQSLNGYWKFNWSLNPTEAPAEFYQKDYPGDNWKVIPVPSNWQMHGYGRVHYRNVDHAIPSDPPNVPEDYNPVGCYIKTFQVPEEWNNREIFLRFDGVKSAFYAWVNGKKIGYDQGSMTPAEFNITSYLQEGENQLAVKVYRFSDGTYLECQDMVRLSGIYRQVYLYSKPKVHLKDFYVRTDLDKSYKDANLFIDAKVGNSYSNNIDNCIIQTSLLNSGDQKVFTDSPF